MDATIGNLRHFQKSEVARSEIRGEGKRRLQKEGLLDTECEAGEAGGIWVAS